MRFGAMSENLKSGKNPRSAIADLELGRPWDLTAMPAFPRATRTRRYSLPRLKNAGCKTVFKDDGISGATTGQPFAGRIRRL